MQQKYTVAPGPEGFISPSAALMGVVLPDAGQALLEGSIVDEDAAMEEMARKFLSAKNPVFFPGPQLLWNWKEGVSEKAKALKELSIIAGAKIIPMPDYRPKYPKINPEIEINPNHPNLTIWHNEIDVCLFVGVHCHYANVALKIIRSGTSCYTVALCGEAGHEDAMISIRDTDVHKIEKLIRVFKRIKAEKTSA